jgi:hypothetical protein
MPVPAGTVGDNLFTAAAGAGVVPWCVRTRYYATYVKNGTESNPSPFSVEFRSDDFTFPRLTVPARAGFEINWYRESDVYQLITLPRVQMSEGVVFRCSFQFTIGSASYSSFSRIVDLRSFGDGRPTITLNLADFVDEWNNGQQVVIPAGSATGGQLRIVDGKLVLDPIVVPGPNQPVTIYQPKSWWSLMGFGTTGLMTNTPFIAERGPNNQHVSTSEPIGNGPTFTDTQNPCQILNPPTSSPNVEFDFEF